MLQGIDQPQATARQASCTTSVEHVSAAQETRRTTQLFSCGSGNSHQESWAANRALLAPGCHCQAACFPAHRFALWTASMCTCVGPSGNNGGQAATWRQAHHSLQWHRVPWLIYCESVDAQRGPKCTTARCSQAKVSLLHTHFLWGVKKLNTCPPVPAWLAGI